MTTPTTPTTVTTTGFVLGCESCGLRSSHHSVVERADARAVHTRACSGVIREWVDQRERPWVDLTRTSWCPRGGGCELCGDDIDVITEAYGTRLGVGCVRICTSCVDADREPPAWGTGETIERIALHCQHLGITLDQMADQLQAEENGGHPQ